MSDYLSIRLLMVISVMIVSSTGLIQATQTSINGRAGSNHLLETNTTIPLYSNNSRLIQTPSQATDRNNCETNTDCSPWTRCDNNTCKCRNISQIYETTTCSETTLQLSVLRCHCATFDNETRQLVTGHCLENCDRYRIAFFLYLKLPRETSRLNKFMCEDRWNRTGRLCGKCLPGHSPLVYSYDMRCVKCPDGNKNVWKYILAAYGPLTLFYFIILFFKINATSSWLHGFLILSQIISTPTNARNIYISAENHKYLQIPSQLALALYSIWNLDFFKGLYPDICLDVSPLTALALDYTVAIYPLLLTVVSYFLIELHDRNLRLVVFLWKPFRFLLTLFRRNWNSRTTVIDAFSTFFLLSFVKIACVSADLLIPVKAHDLNSDNYTWVLYYDATVKYFGSEHQPYVFLAIVLSTVLTIIPTLLLFLYPFGWFHRILNSLKIRFVTLQIVMDSFQGCYKNGTEAGTRDCRWFAAVPLIGRFVLLLIYALTLDTSSLPLETATIVCIMIFTVIVQPYKSQFAKHIKTDTILWGLLAIFYTMDKSATYSPFQPKKQLQVSRLLRLIVVIVPLVYMSCITGYWMLSRMRKVKILIDRVKAWRRGYTNLEEDFEATLPDRLVNPEQYQGQNLHDLVGSNTPIETTRN